MHLLTYLMLADFLIGCAVIRVAPRRGCKARTEPSDPTLVFLQGYSYVKITELFTAYGEPVTVPEVISGLSMN